MEFTNPLHKSIDYSNVGELLLNGKSFEKKEIVEIKFPDGHMQVFEIHLHTIPDNVGDMGHVYENTAYWPYILIDVHGIVTQLSLSEKFLIRRVANL